MEFNTTCSVEFEPTPPNPQIKKENLFPSSLRVSGKVCVRACVFESCPYRHCVSACRGATEFTDLLQLLSMAREVDRATGRCRQSILTCVVCLVLQLSSNKSFCHHCAQALLTRPASRLSMGRLGALLLAFLSPNGTVSGEGNSSRFFDIFFLFHSCGRFTGDDSSRPS